jgi:hypothetical protein
MLRGEVHKKGSYSTFGPPEGDADGSTTAVDSTPIARIVFTIAVEIVSLEARSPRSAHMGAIPDSSNGPPDGICLVCCALYGN